ncbi:hypothetical protein KUTeg_004364 [Tegillarca granosa]|uniref:Uncharacterized protein n=1 Tax=Tegillarca granosa TaxID=220873 RepID=A0ABQ9FU91_TEGGR|nr:hypothetical protein KUTeg_004364 [Tegillarca granosa]
MVLVPYDRYQRLTALKLGVKHSQDDVKNVQPKVIIPESEPEVKLLAEDRPNIENILVAVPVNVRNKARALLIHLRKYLKWNERGEISVDGRIIPGSNIVDLVKVSVKEYKDFEHVGLESFSKVIYDSNAPLTLIAPSKRQIGSGLPPPPGIAVRTKTTHRWIDVLDKITTSYNHTYHRTIKRTPASVTPKDSVNLWKTIYEVKVRPKTKSKRNDESTKTPYRRIFKFKVGDVVRISFLKRPFQKEYDERWSRELFVVTERFVREGIPQYKLKDYANDVIDGTFYQNQSQEIDGIGIVCMLRFSRRFHRGTAGNSSIEAYLLTTETRKLDLRSALLGTFEKRRVPVRTHLYKDLQRRIGFISYGRSDRDTTYQESIFLNYGGLHLRI